MSIFSRPLVALSLTEPDAELLGYVSLVAESMPFKEVRFAHVIATETQNPSAADIQVLRERMQNEVARQFDAKTIPCEFEVLHGPRADQLLALAVRHEHDVIFLGHRRGRRGRRSLARHLAMIAPCSVWMVPEAATPRIDHILVPVDFSEYSADALQSAVKLARARGLKTCTALHVFFDPSIVRYDEHIEEVLGNETAAFQRFLGKIDLQGIEVDSVFEESTHHAEAILRVAHRHESDLIVMSTHGRSRAAAILLGSVTAQVLAETPLPLLAVKHFGRRMTILQALIDHRFWEGSVPRTG